MRKRAVYKNGDTNTFQTHLSKTKLKFVVDYLTTLVDMQWRWMFTLFAVTFLASWLIFALIWYMIAFTHGDLDDEHLPNRQAEINWIPCVLNILGFPSCFLYSLETQFTTGYGVRTITEECPEAVFILTLQCVVGMIIEAFMTGIIFLKMTKPKMRSQTLVFSRNAVICLRDGHLCLMFRLGDLRKSHIIGANIKAHLIHTEKTSEGELLENYQTQLTVSADETDADVLLIWPMTIVHKIDKDSPLYNLSPSEMLREKFEIVIILDGSVESTDQSMEARSSYLPNEILWGHKFEDVLYYNYERQGYDVNFSKFDNAVAIDTPLCSAAELAESIRLQQSFDDDHKYDGLFSQLKQPTEPPPLPPSGRPTPQRRQSSTIAPIPQQRPSLTSSMTRPSIAKSLSPYRSGALPQRPQSPLIPSTSNQSSRQLLTVLTTSGDVMTTTTAMHNISYGYSDNNECGTFISYV